MNHPILVGALAEDPWRWCRCGAVAQQRYSLCRECQAVAVWRQETSRTRRHAIPSWTRARATQVRFFARVVSLIRLSSREAEG